jgi:cation:H+ antiporter
MALSIVLLVVGLVLLYKGGDWLVIGSSSLAKRLGVRDLVIGLTLVAFGTSAPEMMVSVVASFKGSAALSVANVIGSNIANVLLIVGVAALVYPLNAARGTVWKEIPFVLLASVVLVIQANDRWLSAASANVIDRGDGLILLAFFLLFLYYIRQLIAEGVPVTEGLGTPVAETMTVPKASLRVVLGIVFLLLGGNWVVSGAVDLAQRLGVGENIIGLTIVAIGTSLPELATSVAAALRKKSDIAIGNIIGSSIFNIFLVLGVASLVAPLEVAPGSNGDLLVMLGTAVLLFIVMFTGKERHQVQRFEGGLFFGLYVAYLGWIVLRSM